ncbi:MAG TPA: hypothetical protein PLS50_09240 [Candidatus Dojkabacteria bacterium]|nr:hypothetical protein [Candidatus Dojkabacteria bacterium]
MSIENLQDKIEKKYHEMSKLRQSIKGYYRQRRNLYNNNEGDYTDHGMNTYYYFPDSDSDSE